MPLRIMHTYSKVVQSIASGIALTLLQVRPLCYFLVTCLLYWLSHLVAGHVYACGTNLHRCLGVVAIALTLLLVRQS
jgi:hypothetical protein